MTRVVEYEATSCLDFPMHNAKRCEQDVKSMNFDAPLWAISNNDSKLLYRK